MNNRSFPPLVPLALAGSMVAQTVVSPPHFAAAEGNTAHFAPFGDTNLPARWQQVDATLIGQPRTIAQIRFRRDAFDLGSYPSKVCVMSVRVSHAATTAATMSTIRANNHGPDVQLVRSGTITIPASTWSGLPEPFQFVIPFTPFQYDGVAPLCWEIEVTSATPNNLMRCDQAWGTNANPTPWDIQSGNGCVASGYVQTARLTGFAGGTWVGSAPAINFTWNGSFLPPSGVGLLVLDVAGSPTMTIPGTRCDSYVRPGAWFLALAQANGTFAQSHLFPVRTSYNGLSLFAQHYALDAAAPGGLVTTNGFQFNLVAPWTAVQVSSVRQVGTNAPQLLLNRGFVVEFR